MNKPIPDFVWDYQNRVPFDFEITDTSIYYNIYVNVRHKVSYSYNNLWLIVRTTFPSGEMIKKRVELPLADKDGKWYGNCMGNICDIQIPIQGPAYFNTPGKYTIELEQNMRQNPLPYIMEMGVRVERSRLTSVAHKETEPL